MGVKSPRQRLIIRCAVVLSILVFAGFGASLCSLVRIQFVQGEAYRAKAELSQILDEDIPAQRGTIYDSNGKVLAKSASVWKIYINPKKIAELANEGLREDLITKLSTILAVDAEKVRELTYKNNLEYAEVKTKVEFDKKEEIVALRKTAYKNNPDNADEKGIYYSYVVGIRDDEKRYYPYGNFASEVIGFCGTEGGSFGLEKSCDALLKGTPGRMLAIKNAGNDTIPFKLETVHAAQQGANLVLTIDEQIQNYLESGLKQVYESSKGIGAYGIIMDPNTGAVLAMAGMPDYDLNAPDIIANKAIDDETNAVEDAEKRSADRTAARLSQWTNYCTQWSYEPGSVFKTFIASAAVEEKLWSLTETYTCTGGISIKDRRISCHKPEGHGTQALSQALVNSCNPFFVTVGQRLGVDTFYKYFDAFGFREKTGIELDEINSTYHDKNKMGAVELASSSFGQSFEVTPIQMITAISAIANGGKLMRPYIIDKQLDEDGNIVSVTEPYVRRQVISETTAATVTDMMEQVVIRGSGKNAYVPGYRVAGKTGTSEKLRKMEITGLEKLYIASFACFAPADNARIAILIAVDEPVDQIGGGQIVAPIAGEIVENTLKYLNVEPKYSPEELSLLNTKAPSLIGIPVTEATAKLAEMGLAYKKIGSGDMVIAQNPIFNRSLPKNGIVALYTDEDVQAVKTKVPDFANKSISEVYKLAVESGINIKVTGSILTISELVSYKQSVEPGLEVDYGSEIVVNFKSRAVTSEAGG